MRGERAVKRGSIRKNRRSADNWSAGSLIASGLDLDPIDGSQLPIRLTTRELT